MTMKSPQADEISIDDEHLIAKFKAEYKKID